MPKACPECGTAFAAPPSGRVFCSRLCFRTWLSRVRMGASNPRWKGGRHSDKRGYVMLSGHHDHPRASQGLIREHILVAEAKIGRLLLPGEVPHHVNEDKSDNRPENLSVKPDTQHRSEHMRLHNPRRKESVTCPA